MRELRTNVDERSTRQGEAFVWLPGTKQSTPLTSVFPRAMPELCQRARDCRSVLDSRALASGPVYVRAFPECPLACKAASAIEPTSEYQKDTSRNSRLIDIGRQIERASFKAPNSKAVAKSFPIYYSSRYKYTNNCLFLRACNHKLFLLYYYLLRLRFPGRYFHDFDIPEGRGMI